MVTKKLSIFTIAYDWYEGEHNEMLVAKEISKELFEQDLRDARQFAQELIGKKFEGEYLGKGYSVECLPEYYEQVLWFLTEKKEYIYCEQDTSVEYFITDDVDKKIGVQKKTRAIRWDDM